MKYKVRVERLEQFSPFRQYIWDGPNLPPITRREVRTAIKENRFCDYQLDGNGERKDHVERIAYLVVNKDETPIEVDVGVPELGWHEDWWLQDGHHRLAAAIYRKDEYIWCSVAGSVKYAEEVLGVKATKRKKGYFVRVQEA